MRDRVRRPIRPIRGHPLLAPIAAAALGALLILELWTLPNDPDRFSAARERWDRAIEPGPGVLVNLGLPEFNYIFLTPDGAYIAVSTRDPEARVPAGGGLVASAVPWDRYDYGLWRPTRRVHTRRASADSALSPEEARQLAHSALAAGGPDRFTADIAPGPDGWEVSLRSERGLWIGYLHNAAALALLAGFAWSTSRSVRMGVLFARRRSRIAAGLCPGCRYDLRGLPGPNCPECGSPVRELS